MPLREGSASFVGRLVIVDGLGVLDDVLVVHIVVHVVIIQVIDFAFIAGA